MWMGSISAGLPLNSILILPRPLLTSKLYVLVKKEIPQLAGSLYITKDLSFIDFTLTTFYKEGISPEVMEEEESLSMKVTISRMRTSTMITQNQVALQWWTSQESVTLTPPSSLSIWALSPCLIWMGRMWYLVELRAAESYWCGWTSLEILRLGSQKLRLSFLTVDRLRNLSLAQLSLLLAHQMIWSLIQSLR